MNDETLRAAMRFLAAGTDQERVLRFVYQHGFMEGGLAVMRRVVEPLTERIKEEACPQQQRKRKTPR
jgi:hypothetical protein